MVSKSSQCSPFHFLPCTLWWGREKVKLRHWKQGASLGRKSTVAISSRRRHCLLGFLASLSIRLRFCFLIHQNWTSAPCYCSAELTEMNLVCCWGLLTILPCLSPSLLISRQWFQTPQKEGAGTVKWRGLVVCSLKKLVWRRWSSTSAKELTSWPW